MRISGLELTVSDVIQSQSQYAEGWMAIVSHDMGSVQSANLTFRSTAPAEPVPKLATDLLAYWKFSVFTDDVEATRTRLMQLGWTVTEPVQFLDIGYLCHTADRDGLSIELLQREFVPPRTRPIESSPTLWFHGSETLGLITLRISSVEPNLAFYQAVLGMKLLAVMDVNDGRPDPFSLYFLALTSDAAPNPDPHSVDNREWLYHRPYTIIELQHHWSVDGRPEPQLWHPPASVPGFSHVDIQTDAIAPLRERAQQAGGVIESHHDTLLLYSPDGHRFRARPR